MARRTILRPFIIPRIKIVNRCIYCGKIIPAGYIICQECNHKMALG